MPDSHVCFTALSYDIPAEQAHYIHFQCMVLRLFQEGILLKELSSASLSAIHKLHIAGDICYFQRWKSVLGVAEEVSRTAHFQVFLRYLEAICSRRHYLHSLHTFIGGIVRDKYTAALEAAPSHSSAKLVQK